MIWGFIGLWVLFAAWATRHAIKAKTGAAVVIACALWLTVGAMAGALAASGG